MNTKKIAFVINSLGMGGAEHVVKNLAEYFYSKGHEILLITSRKAEREYEINCPVKRILLEEEIDKAHSKPPKRLVRIPARVATLKAIWKDEKPDIIISFIGKMNIYTMLSAGRFSSHGDRSHTGVSSPNESTGDRPFLPGIYLSVRSDPAKEYPGLLMPLAKFLFKKCNGIIFQTKDAARAFVGTIEDNSAILPNALDESFIRPVYTGKRDNRIVMVGRLDANKNHKMVIKALAGAIKSEAFKNKENIPILELYGDSLPGDSTASDLQKLTEDLGIKEHVVFMGRRNGIRDLIETASMFILSSNYEGMPNALLEAMATGLAVISTDCPCGGPATVIKTGENGVLVPVGDESAMEDAIVRLWNDEPLRQRLGENASAIQNDLSPEKVCRMWEDFVGAGIL